MVVFYDSDFICHTTNDTGTYTSIETDAFDGKCKEYIEGCRYVPEGKSWRRPDGEVFRGEAVILWKDSRKLEAAQQEYEKERLADAENALAILLGGETV